MNCLLEECILEYTAFIAPLGAILQKINEGIMNIEKLTFVLFLWPITLLVAYVAGIRAGQVRHDSDLRLQLARMLWNLEDGQIVTHRHLTVRKAGDHWQTDDLSRRVYDCDDEGMCELLDFLTLKVQP
jgi:hypothetical protein